LLARSRAFAGGQLSLMFELMWLPGDLIFILFGALPILVAVGIGYFSLWSGRHGAAATRTSMVE
jgi:hypothetical protein